MRRGCDSKVAQDGDAEGNGRGHGGGISALDDALSRRSRSVRLGRRRNPLQGQGEVRAPAGEMPDLRQGEEDGVLQGKATSQEQIEVARARLRAGCRIRCSIIVASAVRGLFRWERCSLPAWGWQWSVAAPTRQTPRRAEAAGSGERTAEAPAPRAPTRRPAPERRRARAAARVRAAAVPAVSAARRVAAARRAAAAAPVLRRARRESLTARRGSSRPLTRATTTTSQAR